MDLADKYSQICVLDEDGEVSEEVKVRTTPKAVSRYFRQREPSLVALEVGVHSPWVSQIVQECDHRVLVANARKLALIYKNHDKNDKTDAELLARLARVDTKLLSPIQHRKEETRIDLSIIRARACLVETRTKLINHVRGAVKSTGERLASCTADSFYKLADDIPANLRETLRPIMNCIEKLTHDIKEYDKKVDKIIYDKYPETGTLRQVPGVGPILSLSFILTLEDPNRFCRSRQVGSYLGLCPKRSQTGESDPQLRISKSGDIYLRKLLVGSAQYILGRFAPDSDLRRWGLKLAQRGGKNAKNRAVVAVARRLAVLLHRLWLTGEQYEPLRQANRSKTN
jgi:transposase